MSSEYPLNPLDDANRLHYGNADYDVRHSISANYGVDGGEKLVHFGGELWTGRMVTLCSGQLRNATSGVSAVLFSKLEVLLV